VIAKRKSGQFDFTTASTTTSLLVDSIFLNGQLYQTGSTLHNSLGTIWFGAYNGSSQVICFYGNDVNDNAPPAGRWRFKFTSAANSNTKLSCSYTLLSGGTLSSFDPGTISSTQTICTGTTPASLTGSTPTGCTSPATVSYQWRQSTDGNTYTNISGATSASYSPGALTQTTYYHRVATCSDGATASSDPVVITVVSGLTWVGTTNAFATASNWNNAISPAGCAVTIPTVTSPNVYPSATSNITVAAVTINSGAQLTISGTSTSLSMTGNFSNNGTVSGSGKLVFAGTSTQTITGNGSVEDASVSNNTGVVVSSGSSNKLNVTGILSFSTSTGTMTTNSNVVLKSSSGATATIGAVSGCPRNPFIGDITVERFIPASRRSFRFLTPGLTTTTSIYSNWQEGSSAISGQSVNVTDPYGYPNISQNRYNPNPGYGTHITGSTTGANGLDATVLGNPSLFVYSNTGSQWSSIVNTSSPTFKVGEAYQLMVRGSRATDLRTNTPTIDNTVLRVTGTPEVCVFQFNTTATAQYPVPLNGTSNSFSFIGNPFWSVVDWHLVSKSGISNTIYYWDPTLSGTNGRGAYVTYNEQSQTNNNGSSRLNRYIQPGQAFFVENSNPSATRQIIFEDADKVDDQKGNKRDLFRLTPEDLDGDISFWGRLGEAADADNSIEKFYVSLSMQPATQGKSADGFAVTYSSRFKDEFSSEDAPKPTNLDENIEARYKNAGYSILGLRASDFFYKSDTIDLRLTQLSNRAYTISFDFSAISNLKREAILWDRSTGEKIALPIGDKYVYAFTQPAGVSSKTNLSVIFNSMKKEAGINRPENNMLVFPNPAVGLLRFLLPKSVFSGTGNQVCTAHLYSNTGQLLLSQVVQISDEGLGLLDIGRLPAGAYLLKTVIGETIFSSKIIKQ
jgi:hypothetical protein